MSTNRIVTEQSKKLYNAAEKGDVATVNRLLSSTPKGKLDMNYRKKEDYGANCLIAAVENNHADVVEALLNANADASVLRVPDLNSPLHIASMNKNDKIVKLLLAKKSEQTIQGVDKHPWSMLDAQNQYGNTPLHAAAMNGSLECVKLLIASGSDINARNKEGSSVLHHACYCEDDCHEIIKFLVDLKLDVNSFDNFHTTPLMVAAKKKQTEGCKCLLKAGAKKDLMDEHGKDALYYAQLRGHDEIVKLLSKN